MAHPAASHDDGAGGARRQIIRAARAERAGLLYVTDPDLLVLTDWYTARIEKGTTK